MENSYMDTLEESFSDLLSGAVEFVPKLLVAVLLILVGLVLAGIFSRLLGRLVNLIETSNPVRTAFSRLGLKKVDVDGVVTIFTKWAILLVFIAAAVDVLELEALTETFDALVDFIPNIFAAVIVAGLSFIAGNVMHDVVLEATDNAKMRSAKLLANTAKIAVLVFGLPLAVAQLGLDLTLLTNNITVLVAGVTLALALAFGLGGKEVAGKILNDAYKNWKK